jgi:CheY-like chemotaxis protein
MVDGTGIRVLVVDNSVDTVDSLVLLLGLWGHHAEACYSGIAALQIARTFQPHVVLLDLAMPCMDGFQFARRLREQLGSRPVALIALTGYTDEALRSRAWEMGFSRYLVKPVDLDQLQELLDCSTFLETALVTPRGVGTRYEAVADGPGTARCSCPSLVPPPPLLRQGALS